MAAQHHRPLHPAQPQCGEGGEEGAGRALHLPGLQHARHRGCPGRHQSPPPPVLPAGEAARGGGGTGQAGLYLGDWGAQGVQHLLVGKEGRETESVSDYSDSQELPSECEVPCE